MKIIKYTLLSILIASLTVSCEDFLTLSPSDQVLTEDAFEFPKDIETGLYGLYNRFGFWPFMGRNVVALGDIAADNAWMTGSSGHFDNIYLYTISSDSPDLLDIWETGYMVANGAAKLIKAAPKVLENYPEAENIERVNNGLAQAYALKAMSQFYLVNIFGLPYSQSNASTLGVIIIKDEPIIEFEKVERGTVGDTYKQIINDINEAKKLIKKEVFNPFTINEASIYAFEARVKLYMQEWEDAKTSAQKAIDLSGGEIVTDSTKYIDMWGSIAATSEDIFTIAKLSNDNLSANSLNTLYGSYNGKVLQGLYNLFDKRDMRQGLFEVADAGKSLIKGLKYKGLSESAATSNIPVLRIPEMHLIIAEAKAQLEEADAVDYVFNVAKRNPDLKKSDIPTDKEDLLNFISIERRRELFQEGHRWFDARRTGESLSRNGTRAIFTDFDVSKFVYPIPSQEVNASGITQNDNWNKTLPVTQ